ncbi:MAG: OmpH family outer membrane protein [Bacteroidota bacterium]|jgi:outer membrane protein
MKTTGSTLTKITLGLIVAASVVACNNKPAAAPAAATTTTTTADKGTTVYINSDTLLSKYEYAKDMQARLNEKGKAAESAVISRNQALQREVAEYQKIAATLPADKRQATEERLRRENNDFQKFQQSESADMQTNQATETGKLFDKLTDFSKNYAKEKGYKLVLTYSRSAPGVLYVDPSLDITAEALKTLNDAYAKDKK